MRSVLAAALILASPAVAQPRPAAEQSSIPTEFLGPSEQMRAFFARLSAQPMTDQMFDAIFRGATANLAPMDAIVESSFVRGEEVPDWQTSGVDIRAAIAGREGGLAGNFAIASSPLGPAFVYYEDRSIDELVPPDWTLVARRGEPFEGDIVQVEIGRVSPKVILAERVAYRRQGNAYCRLQAESRLYADPQVTATGVDAIGLFIMMRSLRLIERERLCQVTEEAGPGEYRVRLFDAEGHRLTALDRSDAFRIVPHAPIQIGRLPG
jgi:hypothetical protein